LKPPFQFYGKQPDLDQKQIRNDEPINLVEYRNNELRSFTEVFRREVMQTVRHSGGLFSHSSYCDLNPQFEAFDRLKEMLKNAKWEIHSIEQASFKKDEALYRVQVRISVMSSYYSKLFKEPLPPGSNGYVLISFYTGVCREFTSLHKPCDLNDMMGRAARASKGLAEQDPAFDPQNIIPVFLDANRFIVRHNYLDSAERYGHTRYYQTPEGFIYRIEVDGYSAFTMPVSAVDTE
jgi:hypothetical protein